jgi:hypothetical protein
MSFQAKSSRAQTERSEGVSCCLCSPMQDDDGSICREPRDWAIAFGVGPTHAWSLLPRDNLFYIYRAPRLSFDRPELTPQPHEFARANLATANPKGFSRLPFGVGKDLQG